MSQSCRSGTPLADITQTALHRSIWTPCSLLRCLPVPLLRAASSLPLPRRLVWFLLCSTSPNLLPPPAQASELTDEQLAALKKRRQFKKFSFRGIDLEKLLEMSNSPELVALLPSRIRRRFRRATIDRKHMHLMKKLRKSKRECGPLDKPEPVRTHLRNMIILPEMIGNVIYIYNGRGHVVVEVRPDMIGKYFGEFSITYKPTLHGRPGLGATHSSRFIPLH